MATTVILLITTASVSYAIPVKPQPKTSVDLLPVPPETKAVSAILTESRRGQVLMAKEPDKKLHISVASKLMTAMVVLEKAKLDTKVTISKESVGSEGSTLDLEVGEKYSIEDLLYSLILTSANDVANSLAEFIGGDIDKFVVLMNSKASELNMKNTHFSNPSGLYNEQQFTTASDIAILMRYALNNPDFNTIFSCAAKPWTTKNGVEVLTNQNDLFWSYDGVDGGKTGYNNKKQQSAITTATHLGQRLICIVLDSPDNDSMLEDSTKLFDYGFKNFRTGILVSKDHSLRVIQINNQEVNLVSKNDIYYTFPVGQSYIKSLNFDMATDMKPPVSTNLIAGTARYTLADDTIIDVSLYPDTEINVPEDSLTSAIKKIKENKDIMLLLNILILTEVFLVLYNIFKLVRRLTGRLIKNKGKSA
jgi:D-alanyl-D-alanine carboxypeptidase/D-alanyl-D-alanine carboxypeptidase (penicillin-binding protein 5/6)